MIYIMWISLNLFTKNDVTACLSFVGKRQLLFRFILFFSIVVRLYSD